MVGWADQQLKALEPQRQALEKREARLAATAELLEKAARADCVANDAAVRYQRGKLYGPPTPSLIASSNAVLLTSLRTERR
jgi:hypothetical protein